MQYPNNLYFGCLGCRIDAEKFVQIEIRDGRVMMRRASAPAYASAYPQSLPPEKRVVVSDVYFGIGPRGD